MSQQPKRSEELLPNTSREEFALEEAIVKEIAEGIDIIVATLQRSDIFKKELLWKDEMDYETFVDYLLGLFEGVIDREHLILLYNNYLIEIYKRGAYSTIDEVPDMVVTFDAPDLEFLLFMHTEAPMIFNRFFDFMGERVRKSILTGISKREGWQGIQVRLQRDLGYSKDRANKIIRTEFNRALNQARINEYKTNKFVVGLQYAAEMDGHPCSESPKCADLHGDLYSIEDAEGMLPRHPRCRCTWAPVTQMAIDAGLV
jgi:SPP1 gp7 family putative phage head morphogenesis protein